MQEYLDTVRSILEEGNYRPNRTGVDTVSTFMQTHEIDLSEGFPLLTTKKMDGFRWKSLIHELLWYFSGEEHVRKLREKTSIWDEWADEEGHLETAYGRFWRRYPLPDESAQLEGEAWADEENPWVEEEDGNLVFDQIQYIIDTLKGDNPERGPNSRRLVVNAWHPGNAGVSLLPPCHYTFVFNVQNGRLNVHLTQRSGDIALGVPFNIAAYALIANIVAQRTGLKPGKFGHSIVDAHIYSGKGERGEWYRGNLQELSSRVEQVDDRKEFLNVREWLEEEAPGEEEEGYDHVPGLLEQLSREPLSRSKIDIEDRPLDDLEFEDINLEGYESHDGIRFEVAE